MPPFSALGSPAPVGSLEKALRQFWASDSAGTTRASLINLAVYSEKSGSLLENNTLMRELTQEHACRSLLIEVDRANKESSIEAWVTAHCHLLNGKKAVCCEQIAFHLKGKVTGRMRNTVFSHLESDLPLVFWWQGELSPLLSKGLYSLIDRLIFDSSQWHDPAKNYQKLKSMRSAIASPAMLQDLEWVRTANFRHATASLFDDPHALELLACARELTISYNPSHQISALLLLAWFTTQAGWLSEASLPLKIINKAAVNSGQIDCLANLPNSFLTTSGGEVQIKLVPAENVPTISSLAISSSDSLLKVAHSQSENHLSLSFETAGHRIFQPAPADPQTTENLIASMLSRGSNNVLYNKIFPTFLHFLFGPASRKS